MTRGSIWLSFYNIIKFRQIFVLLVVTSSLIWDIDMLYGISILSKSNSIFELSEFYCNRKIRHNYLKSVLNLTIFNFDIKRNNLKLSWSCYFFHVVHFDKWKMEKVECTKIWFIKCSSLIDIPYTLLEPRYYYVRITRTVCNLLKFIRRKFYGELRELERNTIKKME